MPTAGSVSLLLARKEEGKKSKRRRPLHLALELFLPRASSPLSGSTSYPSYPHLRPPQVEGSLEKKGEKTSSLPAGGDSFMHPFIHRVSVEGREKKSVNSPSRRQGTAGETRRDGRQKQHEIRERTQGLKRRVTRRRNTKHFLARSGL